MNTLKKTVEIRRYKKAVFFKTGLIIGGVMAFEVLVLNPDDEKNLMMVTVENLNKLPHRNWAMGFVANSGRESTMIVSDPEKLSEYEVVWRGGIGTDTYKIIEDELLERLADKWAQLSKDG